MEARLAPGPVVTSAPRRLAASIAWVAVAALGALPAAAGAHPGTGIVEDGAGRIFFTDLVQVWRFAPDGRLAVAVPRTHTHELYLDPSGNLYGEHLEYEAWAQRWWTRAWKLAPDGVVSEYHPRTEGYPHAVSPAVDGAGNRYFADINHHLRETARIYRRPPRGEPTLVAGGAWGARDGRVAQARFGSIGGLTAAPDGTLYVADGDAIRVVSRDGLVSTRARGGLLRPGSGPATGGLSNHLRGIVADAEATVFVANSSARRVLRISPRGDVTVVARSGWPWEPAGVALSRRGLIVLEYRVPPLPGAQPVRVRRVAADGRVTLLAQTPDDGR